jgi:hypothetical protein
MHSTVDSEQSPRREARRPGAVDVRNRQSHCQLRHQAVDRVAQKSRQRVAVPAATRRSEGHWRPVARAFGVTCEEAAHGTGDGGGRGACSVASCGGPHHGCSAQCNACRRPASAGGSVRSGGSPRQAEPPPLEHVLGRLWDDLQGLLHDQLLLASLESRQALAGLVRILVLAVTCAALLLVAWGAAMAAVLIWLLDSGLSLARPGCRRRGNAAGGGRAVLARQAVRR